MIGVENMQKKITFEPLELPQIRKQTNRLYFFHLIDDVCVVRIRFTKKKPPIDAIDFIIDRDTF